jgi:hypothetical protein
MLLERIGSVRSGRPTRDVPMSDATAGTESRGTMVVQMTIDPSRSDEVDRHFREDVRPWAERQPGFVSGQWIRLGDGDRGMGLVVFETVALAREAAKGPSMAPRIDGRAWNTDSVHVFTVVTQG